MKLLNLLESTEKQIVIVSGNLCSGKNYFCSKNFADYTQITVSDVVRFLSKVSSRSELAKTSSLDQQIATTIIAMIDGSKSTNKFIVDGIRQITILQALQQHFGDQIKQIIWLDTPDDVAKERFMNRQSTKDNQDYEAARQGDRNLGIEEVENYIRAKHTVIPH
jgi:predicted kinase